MLASAVLQGVVSDEFASDEVRNRNWTCLINRPDDLKSFPGRCKPCLNRREVILWGYVCNPMTLCEKATKLAFSIEEAPCGSTALLHAPWHRHSGDGCDS